jgi:1L-myo-inositol 1-phosphate cytidylyltransferase
MMKCLIVAAGQGTRLREKGALKPLIRVSGIPLIEHVIMRARTAGVDAFCVVSGYRGDELRLALDEYGARENVSITHIVNDEWIRANGLSVLKAKHVFEEPFLLTMCDHLVDPDIYRDLVSTSFELGTVTLAVDFNVDRLLNDPEDVTRVKCSNGRIEHIGKVIREFDAIDTGVFLCTPVIFDALEESAAAGDDSISGGMNVLAQWNKARVLDIKDRLWVDVDDPIAFGKAEALVGAGLL